MFYFSEALRPKPKGLNSLVVKFNAVDILLTILFRERDIRIELLFR